MGPLNDDWHGLCEEFESARDAPLESAGLITQKNWLQ